MNTLPPGLLDRPVGGVGLAPGTLRDQLGEDPTLLVFLRHFGCIFCKEQVTDLRKAADANPDYPQVLFFTQGSPQESRAFLRTYWPTARAVSDPEFEFYEAMGVRRASLIEGIGPKVIFGARKRAQAKRQRMRSPSTRKTPGMRQTSPLRGPFSWPLACAPMNVVFGCRFMTRLRCVRTSARLGNASS